MTTTATDTLQRKSTDASVISGGHLVARALKNEGVDTIFTLCGGHIIDIYDGCVDEGIRIIDVRHEQVAAHAADGYARQTGKLGCVVTTAGPGCTNAMTGIACAFRAETPVLHIGGQGALTQHKMGSLQDLPHVEMMAPITKFAAGVRSTERVADMIAMAARECFAGAYGPSYLEIPRDVLDREIDLKSAVIPQAGKYRASTRSIGDPADIERLADILVAAKTPCILLGTQVWNCRGHEQAIRLVRGLNIPAYFNGSGRGLLPPGDPHSLQPDALAGVQRGGRDRDRRHAVRLPHGLRQAAVPGGDDRPDRSGLPDRRQEPGPLARPGGRSRCDPGRGRGCRFGPARQRRRRAPGLAREAARGRDRGHRQADAALHVRELADPSLPRGLGDQRVPDRGHDLHRRWRRRGDDQRPSRAAAPAGPLDGSRARSARSASAPDLPWRRSSPTPKRR